MRRHAKAVTAATAALLLTLALSATLATAVAPVVTIEDATDPGYTTADVKGTVNPEGQFTTWRFQYISDALFQENLTNSLPGFEGASTGPEEGTETEETLERELTELSPGTTYHLRLQAENGDGQSEAVAANTFTTEAVGPPTVAIDPVTTFDGATAKFSGTIDPEAPVDDPAFEVTWHFECSPQCPSVEELHLFDADEYTTPADSDPHTVEVDATGLEPNTSYEVTLIAENDGGPVTAGPEQFKTAQVAPHVQTLYAGELEADSAVLAAKVNPGNAAVTYQFEWGTDTSYGNVAPATPQVLGAEDNTHHLVTAPITGLQPGTGYHFRVVATNTDTLVGDEGVDHGFTTLAPLSTQSCANETLRVQNDSTELPDCRAYEMVTPLDKDGSEAVHPGSLSVYSRAARSGGAVTYRARLPYADPASAPLASQYRSERGKEGWVTQNITPPVKEFLDTPGLVTPYFDFDPELNKGVAKVYGALNPGDPEGRFNLYLAHFDSRDFELLSDSELPLPPSGSNTIEVPVYVTSNESFSHSIVGLGRRMTPDTPIDLVDQPLTRLSKNIYEYHDGVLSNLLYTPDADGTGPMAPEPWQWGGFFQAGGSVEAPQAGGSEFFDAIPAPNVISRDGSRIFLSLGQQVAPCSGAPSCVSVFLREDGETTEIGRSQRTTPDPESRLKTFQLATPDGSVAYIVSAERLTDDAIDADLSKTSAFDPSLYRYDVESSALSDLTTADHGGAGVEGAIAGSDDGSRLYFVARGVLAPGAIRGEPNLYLWDEGEGTRLVVTLAPGFDQTDCGSDMGAWTRWKFGCNGGHESQATADGSKLLFASFAQLTSYETDGKRQIYLYDAEANGGSGSLACVSCNREAQRSSRDASLWGTLDHASDHPLWSKRNLSADGDRVVFESAEALVSADTNGQADVYRWQDGRVALLSSGQSGQDSYLLDGGNDGDDVFIATAQGISPDDKDGFYDVYDARVGGGFPRPLPSPACEGDACLAPPVLPNDPTPSSSSYSGPGDPVTRKPRSRRCAKGKARRQGKCVKKNRKKSSRRQGRNK